MKPNILIVAFDDARTSLKVIISALKEGSFAVKGEPVYLKAFPIED